MNTAHWKEIHYGLGQSLPQLHPGLMHKSETPCRSISKPLLLEESPNHLQTGPSHLKPSLSHSHLGLLHTYNQDASCGSFISLPGIQHESHKQGLEADTTLICNADRALKTIVLYMSFFALVSSSSISELSFIVMFSLCTSSKWIFCMCVLSFPRAWSMV